MCGIVGVLNQTDQPPVEKVIIRQMLEMICHRGPDGFGIYRDAHIGLGNARLSIIDVNVETSRLGMKMEACGSFLMAKSTTMLSFVPY